MPPRSPRPQPADGSRPYPWRAVIALVLIYISVALQWNWTWGVLFVLWALPALRTGQVHLIDKVERRERPWLFAFILFTWILLSLLLIWIDVANVLPGNHASGGVP